MVFPSNRISKLHYSSGLSVPIRYYINVDVLRGRLAKRFRLSLLALGISCRSFIALVSKSNWPQSFILSHFFPTSQSLVLAICRILKPSALIKNLPLAFGSLAIAKNRHLTLLYANVITITSPSRRVLGAPSCPTLKRSTSSSIGRPPSFEYF